MAHSLGFRRLPGRWVAALLSALLAASLGQAIRRHVPRETIAGTATAVDGDSLRIGPTMLRLAGIDAPELFQACRGPGGEVACGEEARRALSALLRAGPVRCEVSGLDRYERRLARCFGPGGEINARMVLDGHAVAFGGYEAQEDLARAARRGLWATRFERPADWRAAHPRHESRAGAGAGAG